jgi:general secretion pathway protein A
MNLEMFKLRELPFRLSPDPQFLYLSKAHARAKAYMESTVWFADGFVVITGEIGCGKTTLIETFLQELQNEVIVAQINQTQVSSLEFLQSVLVQFGFKPFKMKKAELLATLNDYLVEQYNAGHKLVLIIDEAQNLTQTVLEEVRLLSGIETPKEKVLRIILAGQPELNDKLDAPELEQLTQRVRLRFHLTTLSETETRAYIEHRLEVAGGGDRDIFAADTFPEVYRYTGGVPRLINTLCDTAMMAAYAGNRDAVRRADIESAVTELRWPPYAARPRPGQPPLGAVPLEDSAPAAAGPAPAPPAPATGLATGLATGTATGTAAGTATTAAAGMPPDAAATLAVRATPAAHTGAELVGKLLVATEGRTVQEVPLRVGRLIVGRTPDNDIHIDSRFISRHHCQIITTAHSCVIEDLNSTNGIYVKSARVRRHYLNDGDVVLVGKHELIYVDERAARGRAIPSDTMPKLPVVTEVPELHAAPGAEADAAPDGKRHAGS